MTSEIFIPVAPLQTAVLFLVFNRPDTTKQVFKAIRQAKPPRLYVAADGPRANREGEAERVTQVREIATAVDWPCEVKTLFRDENLGCKKSVSSGINWFFENENQGIILEDDCLPVQSFFWFCEKILNKYANDTRIMMATGTNYLLDIQKQTGAEFIFSRHYSIWGWATWKRAWESYEVDILDYESDDHKYISLNKHDEKFHQNLIKASKSKNIDTWDYQWSLNCCFNYGLCATPTVNLVSNIGTIGAHADGATENNFMPTKEIDLIRIDFPKRIMPNMYHDAEVGKRNRARPLILSRLIKRIIKWLKPY
ncbi:nucleotide-diphospho-sugar transferase [Limnohabitans sp. 2KL-27]|uniref:nucleotide-diphospho-sugar transferase n=1 Tax=Limnohabitans sp. 2KL-27 TaxID=1100705 RepID=UPI000A5F5715|nr:nucleotide-diphospho-sugar transferase [Limnohabitans sp. 2KL-27]